MVTDRLPDDLNVSEYVGPYVFPNNNRRRVPGYLYLALAVFLAVLYVATRSSSPVLVNAGMLWAALGLALIGGYHLLSGYDLDGLTDGEADELWAGVRLAVRAIRGAYEPDGVNVGLNLGAGAGAGVPDHLHIHCLPRWAGDTNFMTTVAETRVLPEPLAVSWTKLRDAWPD